MAVVDMELRKAFQELQSKMMTSQQQINIHKAQMEALNRQIQHSKIVKSEVEGLSDSTKAYLSVGRMFLLSPKDKILKSLNKEASTHQQKIETMEKQNAYLEKSMKEAEENLRELVASKRSK